MKGHNTFFDNKQRVAEKILLAMFVDYLPGDIYAYTDREGWHNLFVKGEFYGRSKSQTTVARWARQLHGWMTSDFYMLKSPEARKEQEEKDFSLRARHSTLLLGIEDAEARLNKLKEQLADLKHENPFTIFEPEQRTEG